MNMYRSPDKITVPVANVELLCNWLTLMNVPMGAALAGTEVTLEDLDYVERKLTFSQYQSIIQNAARLVEQPDMGWQFGKFLAEEASGVVGLGVKSSRNTGDALKFFVRYFEVQSQLFSVEIDAGKAQVAIRFNEVVDFGPLRETLYQVFISVIEHMFSDVFKGLDYQMVVRLKMDSLGCSLDNENFLVFDQPENCIEFVGLDPDRRLVSSDLLSQFYTKIMLNDILTDSSGCNSIQSRLKSMLSAADCNSMSLDVAASNMAMSPRSLSRHLRKVGTSYSEIKNEIRVAKVKEMMTKEQFNVADICTSMGFDDVPTFKKAFKRWCGINFQDFSRMI